MSNSRKRSKGRDNVQQRFIKQKRRNVLAKPGKREIVIVLDNLKPNFNIGKIFRSAEAFGINRIHLIGIDIFDPAPAKGSFRYVPAVFDDSFKNTFQTLSNEGYEFFVFTPTGDNQLNDKEFPLRSAFVFGHEEFGFSFELSDFPGLHPIHIAQVGRVESLNVSVAASIAMYEYARQYPVKEKSVLI